MPLRFCPPRTEAWGGKLGCSEITVGVETNCCRDDLAQLKWIALRPRAHDICGGIGSVPGFTRAYGNRPNELDIGVGKVGSNQQGSVKVG